MSVAGAYDSYIHKVSLIDYSLMSKHTHTAIGPGNYDKDIFLLADRIILFSESKTDPSGFWGDRNEAGIQSFAFYFSRMNLDLEFDPTTCIDHNILATQTVTITDETATYTPLVANDLVS